MIETYKGVRLSIERVGVVPAGDGDSATRYVLELELDRDSLAEIAGRQKVTSRWAQVDIMFMSEADARSWAHEYIDSNPAQLAGRKQGGPLVFLVLLLLAIVAAGATRGNKHGNQAKHR